MGCILVTGANGFVGSHLCRFLTGKGHEVRGLILPGTPAEGLRGMGVSIIEADLIQAADLAGIGKGVSLVYHLAARVNDWGPRRLFYKSIVLATQQLFAALEADTHVVFASSIAAAGLGNHLNYPDENSPVRFTGIPYGDCKLEAENWIRTHASAYNLSYTIVRPANVVGPGSVWVSYPLLKMKERSGLPLLDGGRHPACLLNVHHLVDALYKMAVAPAARGETFYLMDDWDINWRQYFNDLGKVQGLRTGISLPFLWVWNVASWMEAMASTFDVRLPVSRLGAALTGRDNRVQTHKARQLLDWVPAFSYEDTMLEIHDWIRRQS